MKRLRVIGLEEERDTLLQHLQHMGCVEISEPEKQVADARWMALLKRDTAPLAEDKAEATQLTSALTALNKYAPVKSGLFIRRVAMTEEELFCPEVKQGAMETARIINDATREITRIYAALNKLSASLASLRPWAELDLPLEQEGTARTELIFGTAPSFTDPGILREKAQEASAYTELLPVSKDADQHYFLLVVWKEDADEVIAALRPLSFGVTKFKEMTGTARDNITRLEARQRELERKRAECEQTIVAQAAQRQTVQFVLDRVNQEIRRATVAERFLTDGRIFFAEGWIPAERLDDFAVLSKYVTCAWETADPVKGDSVPTLLKNPNWMNGINMVTEMYSLPAYNGIDPNPLMFLWYVFFFGFMFADVAYGLIIFFVSLVITRKFRPKKTLGQMFQLGMWLGASTTICGVFVGGFFGNVLEVIYSTFLPNAVMPAWMQTFCSGIAFSPVNDPITVLLVAIVVGCFHLLFGQLIHIYMGFRDGKGGDALLDVVPWWIVFVGIGVLVVKGTAIGLLIGILSLICTQGRHAYGIVRKFFGGVKSLYDFTSWLSDVLSYARLMALMLATSVIAQVFNTLGALPGNILVFVLVFLVGHSFNIGVNLIGTYVHAARLQYLEFFGKFYIEGGIPFRPLEYDTKYVDITTEEGY